MWSSWNQALQARCFVRASAVALTMMSLKETLPRSPSCRLRASRASAARSMSTSLVRKKWGTGPSDVTRRLAIVLRICVSGTSSNGVPVTAGCGMRDAGCGAAATAAGVAAWGRAAVASRSRLTTRPPGPEPVTSLRSTPASFAIRLASGEAFTPPASPAGAAAVAGLGVATATMLPASRIPPPDGAGVGGGDQVHHRLVRLALGQRLARLHGVAFLLVPLHQTSLLHRGGERFHEHLGGHGQSR